jgi:transposase-like protein
MFHGSCRRVSKVLSITVEPISKSKVHDLAKKVSSVITVAQEPRYRRCIAVDETKLKVKGAVVYVWSAVDIDSGELLALEASYGKSCLNALIFLKKYLNKPKVIVDRVLGIDELWRGLIRYEEKRFFRYLKEKTSVFHNKLSARNSVQEIKSLNLYLKTFLMYYRAMRNRIVRKLLSRIVSYTNA